MVEGTGFENRQARKGLEGSNPSLSASNVNDAFLGRLLRWEGEDLTHPDALIHSKYETRAK